MIRGVAREYRPQLPRVGLLGLVGLAAAFAESTGLVLVVPIADLVASSERSRWEGGLGPFELSMTRNELMAAAVLLLFVALVGKGIAALLRARLVADYERRTRDRLLDAYLAANYPTQAREEPGRFQVLLSQHCQQAGAGLAAVSQAVIALASLVIFVLTAFVLDAVAAAVLLVAGIGLGLALRPLTTRARRAGRAVGRSAGEAGSAVAETVSAIREIRVFEAREHFATMLHDRTRQVATARHRAVFLHAFHPALYQGLGVLLLVGALGLASTRSRADLAALGAVAVLLVRSLSYSQQIVGAQQLVHQNLPLAEEIAGETAALHDRRERWGERRLDAVMEIELRGVSYSYDDREDALTDVDLLLTPPGVVGLAGPSGAGKSTLAGLVLRLYRPQSGVVLVNGIDATEFAPSSWAQRVSLVPQDPMLLTASVRDNIAFFRPEVSDDDVVEAARAVGLHELFVAWPRGYDSLLGPQVRELSGGQRQRVAIARALAGGAELVVLDEPTSALDPESERWVNDALLRLARRALVVVIAHRPSTLAICERVVWLADGRVVPATDDAAAAG